MAALRQILVAVDFSAESLRALDVARSLAERVGGRLLLMHVVQQPAVSAWQGIPGGGHYLAMSMQDLMDAARERLDDLAVQRVPPQVRGSTRVNLGTPYEEITAAARRLKVGLVVLGTHGHTGLKRMLIGSTAERVVRHAPCSVLTVRQP